MAKETMKAAVLVGPSHIEVKDVPVPEMEPDLLKIRVSACGLCGSDVHMWKSGEGWAPAGEEGFWMGHEFCGVVTDPGESDFKIDDRVTFWANLYCGECDMCQAGQEQLCRDVNGTNYIGFVCDGAYAEQFVGKASNAYLLPDGVSDVAAGCIDPLWSRIMPFIAAASRCMIKFWSLAVGSLDSSSENWRKNPEQAT